MTIGLKVEHRNARLQVIADAIDANVAAGYMEFYTATRPATGAAITAQTLLGTVTFSVACAATITGGLLTFDTITQDAAADADGAAAWARVLDGAGTFVADLSVGESGSGADIIINTVNIVTGGPISVTSGTITEGNA